MRKTFSLSDDRWRLGQVSSKPFGAMNDLDQVKEWLPATVPGDVRLDLLRAGRIPDPFYGMDNAASQWVDFHDWWYVRDVELEVEDDARLFVSFEGIDYQSAVFWNGRELGRHVGMFSQQIYELPHAASGRLAVRVWGSEALPRLKVGRAGRSVESISRRLVPGNPAFADRLATLKCQMSFGWDFAPTLRTCGIWDDVALVRTRAVFIRELWVQGLPDGRVILRFALDPVLGTPLRATATVRGRNFESEPQRFAFDLEGAPDQGYYELRFQVHEPRAWNPWDRGMPNLYDLDLTLSDDEGVLDSIAETFGLRTIELAPNPGAHPDEPPWTFMVNGTSEFIRGANWVPADAIPGRVRREDYAALVQLARAANVNLLRVWGGGLREKRAFYDLCDEQGILVWQEFPFSGAPLDHLHRDRKFLSFVHAECGSIVRALRNHPSLALWCGGNEFSTSANARLVETLRRTAAENDGTRPFKPGSPSRGEHHNWRVWHWLANTRDYRLDDAGFYGEFGLQSPPAADELARFIPNEALWRPGEVWEYHNAELAKLWRYALAINANLDSLTEFVQASQQAQLRGLQVMIEHARRRKGRVSGCAFWQFDEPWPAICWSVVDYARRPKPAYFKIKELYNPVLISFDYPLTPRLVGEIVHGVLWLINDTLRPRRGRLNAFFNEMPLPPLAVEIGPDEVQRVGELELTMATGANALRFELEVEEAVISTNEYDLGYCDRGEIDWFSARLEGISERFKT